MAHTWGGRAREGEPSHLIGDVTSVGAHEGGESVAEHVDVTAGARGVGVGGEVEGWQNILVRLPGARARARGPAMPQVRRCVAMRRFVRAVLRV
eukprot:27998-Prymnesium_polylepis.1